MAGRPGRSGRRPKPLAYHLANGSWRQDRHGPRPPIGTILPAAPTWQPSPEDVAHLQPAGQRFLAAMLARFECSVLEGTVVLEAAYVVDHLAAWRLEAATDPDAARLTLQHQRVLATLLSQLRVMS